MSQRILFFNTVAVLWFILLACSAARAQSSVTGRTKVFILSGQSNMEGYGWVDTLADTPAYDDYPDSFDRIKMYSAIYGANALTVDEVVKPGGNNSRPNFGPELGIALELSEQFPDENLIFIKVAWGGTSIEKHWLNNQKVDGFNIGVYSWFVKRVHDAVAQLDRDNIELSGMIWMQGEGDTDDEALANRYKTNLINFGKKVRKETGFGVPPLTNLPFAYGKIQNAVPWAHGGTVQRMQQAAQSSIDNSIFTTATADADATVWPRDVNQTVPESVPTKPALGYNKCHYDTSGALHVGEALGEAMVYLITGDAETRRYPSNWNFQQPSPFTTVKGDFNNDGIMDFLRLSSTCYFSFLGNGDGTFTAAIHGYSHGWNFGLPTTLETVVGNFDNRYGDDYARLDGDHAHVFLSNGDGTFSGEEQRYPSGWNFGSPTAFTTISGDFDGINGDDYARLSSTCYFVFLNDGYGNFTATIHGYSNGWDFGLPTKLDTIVGNFDNRYGDDYARLDGTHAHIFLSNGDGTFTGKEECYPTGWNFGQPSPYNAIVGDFDNKNGDDYARLSSTCYFVFMNDGNGNFTVNIRAYPPGWDFGLPTTYTTITGDFDGKHGDDFARIDGEHIYYSMSNGDGTFESSIQYVPFGYDFGTRPLVYEVLTGVLNNSGRDGVVMVGGQYSHSLTKLGTLTPASWLIW